MRIRPVLNKTKNLKSVVNNHDAKIVIKGSMSSANPVKSRKYSGDVCADLAYASYFDNRILNELKLMGLI